MSFQSFSMITRQADSELSRIHAVVAEKVLVDGRSDVEDVLSRMLGTPQLAVPRTLDLIGHSVPGTCLLQLGDWVIDASSATVTAFFRGLADDNVLPRLGIHAVRLLGCKTAETAHARATICVLSDILGLEVYGTTGFIYAAHYAATGFRDEWQFLLLGASDLRRAVTDSERDSHADLDPRSLDVDALPAVPLDVCQPTWPRRVANDRVVRSILRLIRRDRGAQMPGLLAKPSCEIAIPSTRSGYYHLAQIVLDGQFVRVYPDGCSQSGVLYPVAQPQTLRALVEQLPAAS